MKETSQLTIQDFKEFKSLVLLEITWTKNKIQIKNNLSF
jgi:hypothetical protein